MTRVALQKLTMETLLGLILNLSEHNSFNCVITFNMSLAEAS
jgi:hypothetical protein